MLEKTRCRLMVFIIRARNRRQKTPNAVGQRDERIPPLSLPVDRQTTWPQLHPQSRSPPPCPPKKKRRPPIPSPQEMNAQPAETKKHHRSHGKDPLVLPRPPL